MHVEASQGTLSSEGYCVCNRLIKNGHMTWDTFSEVRRRSVLHASAHT